MQFGHLANRPFSAVYHVQTVNDRLAVIVKHLIQNRNINASTSNLNVSGTDAAQPTEEMFDFSICFELKCHC